MNKFLSAAIALSVLGAGAAAPAAARPSWDDRYERSYDRGGYQSVRYDRRDRRDYRDYRRGYDRRYDDRCKNSNLDGTVLGAAIGALGGNVISGRGDKTLGTVIGTVAGGVVGNRIDAGKGRCG